MVITIPSRVKILLKKLIASNYQAYVVGGCVRDSLMGVSPKDWDITTNANPDQIKQVFSMFKLINNNGEKHGTITVCYEDEAFEITTFRSETTYSDHRHPDEVAFVSNLQEDLARRDFTINAMAADVEGNIIDYFYGQQDIKNKIIRCVGVPEDRFDEDALRILRGLRFASKYNFFIENRTVLAMLSKGVLLQMISKERIQSELNKMVTYPAFTRLMRGQEKYIMPWILPELLPMYNFKHKSRYHKHDLWEHTLSVMDNVEANHIEKLAALFHDIGKYICFTEESTEIELRHYTGHADQSFQMAKTILARLKYSNDDTEKILWLVKYHDFAFSPKNIKKSVKNLLRTMNEKYRDELFTMFLHLRAADRIDHLAIEGVVSLLDIQKAYDEILINKECFTLRQLAISGNHLLGLGFKGRDIGEILADCLNGVMSGVLENSTPMLLSYVKTTYNTVC